jgi:hypothetical protein
MAQSRRISRILESIRVYEESLRNFEYARELLVQRRRETVDSMMAHIDKALELNEATLDSLHRVIATIRGHLQQEEARSMECTVDAVRA